MGPALVVLVVTLATVVQPLGTDLYLAALPAIRNEYAAPVGMVQLTLAVLVFSFGLSQLLWGPAADRFGRRPVLAAGFLLYAAGAGLGALAPGIEVLIAARAMQGLGIAATMVCGRAIVRDLFEQQSGTHVMTVAMSVLACMTMLIPVTGALLAQALGWRSTLWFMAACGMAGVALVLLRVPETARALNPGALRFGPLFAGYARIARHPSFQCWTLLNACGYAANFGFFSSSAYLFIETFGVSRVGFGLVIGGASVTYLIGTVLCRRWIAAHGIVVAVRRAGFLSLAAAMLLIGPQLANAHTAFTLAAGLWLMLLAYGIHQPCGHVGMATPFPLQAGAASALGGFIFAAAAFLCGTWMGVMYRSGSAAVLSLTTGVLVAATGLIALTLVQRHGRPEVARPAIP
ncbi:Sulfonamide resistance protein [Variovorax sp. PBS-H4]|nr:Sulfonamide resistance protein [Variovorax sp. PBS-H4]